MDAVNVRNAMVQVATGLALSIVIILAPAFLLVLIDTIFSTNLLELYLPIVNVALSLLGIALVPMAYVIDFAVNLLIDFLNLALSALNIASINVRSNLVDAVPYITSMLAYALAALGGVKTVSDATTGSSSSSSTKANSSESRTAITGVFSKFKLW